MGFHCRLARSKSTTLGFYLVKLLHQNLKWQGGGDISIGLVYNGPVTETSTRESWILRLFIFIVFFLHQLAIRRSRCGKNTMTVLCVGAFYFAERGEGAEHWMIVRDTPQAVTHFTKCVFVSIPPLSVSVLGKGLGNDAPRLGNLDMAGDDDRY